ncbi:TPA: 30S ribosomal protein S13 [Candidatus Dependentiae bacterium]|nr:MAG: SSU ribosomal protein S13P [candidate division TM6 bacterium GW2011_GWE2_31_21]KKP53105.1 MAG: SSU ribosomal protein S13P [candidate division TM6 bacterium GW2011_GWF2_33_332]HBS47923.1 30S ribosomal protein S13 [Candidatus Dependentiae bacterium]HBZ73473.1 30S ribosomal protein S13 [Candidatus Dependentiae bacterium]
MARISGIYLPKDKRIEVALTYIYGIGLKLSKDILKETGVNPDKRVYDLTDEEASIIQRKITNDYTIGGDLKKEITLNIKRLQEIGSYRGHRHKKSLPVRGQRTKTNARTRKGPRKAGSAVALKKAPTKK